MRKPADTASATMRLRIEKDSRGRARRTAGPPSGTRFTTKTQRQTQRRISLCVSLCPSCLCGGSSSLPRELLRRLDLLPAFAAEGLEEGDEVLLLLVGQVQRLHPLVDVGVLDAALIVVLDHLFERLEAAVVHVRGGMLDLAESRGLEGALVLLTLADEVAA